MPAHVYTVVARGISLDISSNNLTLFSLLRDIEVVGQLPASLPEINIATLWERASDEAGVTFIQRIRFVAPDGSVVGHQDTSFTFNKLGQNMLGKVANLPIKQTGRYAFEVLIRREDDPTWSKPVASYPIIIQVSTPASEGGLLESQMPATETDA